MWMSAALNTFPGAFKYDFNQSKLHQLSPPRTTKRHLKLKIVILFIVSTKEVRGLYAEPEIWAYHNGPRV